jgi:CRISPR/Cas system-associated exonuclease Cas4 (RecB family)
MDREIIKGIGYRRVGFDPNIINAMIEDGYNNLKREKKVRQKKSFAPSSIGYGNATCPRYWYMAFEGKYVFDETTDAMAIANMENGSETHTRLESVFEAAGTLIDKNVEIKMTDPPVLGYIDALVRAPDGEVIVGEFKSAKQEIFVYRANAMKAAPYHMYQILLYLKATGKKNGFILYENKNDQSVLVIPVSLTTANEETLDAALEWMRKVYKNWEDGKDGVNLPTRPKGWSRRNKNCKGCPLFEECWDNLPEGNVTILPMEVVK